jgi:hypothetical protein
LAYEDYSCPDSVSTADANSRQQEINVADLYLKCNAGDLQPSTLTLATLASMNQSGNLTTIADTDVRTGHS